MEKLVVYNDKRKLVAISVSYVLIAACIVALGFTRGDSIVWPVLAAVVAACFVGGVVYNVRKMMNRNPLFEYTEQGLTDYTKPEDVISLPWSQVLSVQLKAANSNDLMLDVMGYKTADQFDVITPEMRAQMDANGTDRVYYVLELSGLWVRRSRIKDAYEWIREHVAESYRDIAFSEFKDPLSKLGKKDAKAA